jgi:hypothetical protein
MNIDGLSTHQRAMEALRKNAFEVYRHCFTKKIVVETWDRLVLSSDVNKRQ